MPLYNVLLRKLSFTEAKTGCYVTDQFCYARVLRILSNQNQR